MTCANIQYFQIIFPILSEIVDDNRMSEDISHILSI
jgi:hypothetical protein